MVRLRFKLGVCFLLGGPVGFGIVGQFFSVGLMGKRKWRRAPFCCISFGRLCWAVDRLGRVRRNGVSSFC